MNKIILVLVITLLCHTSYGQTLPTYTKPKVSAPKATSAKTKSTPVKTKIIYVDRPVTTPAATPKEESKTSIEPAMVFIQGGSFNMGSNEEDDQKPIHRVTVSSFKMGKFEVTVKEFAVFIKDTNYQTDAEKIGFSTAWNETFLNTDGVTWRDDEEGRHRPEIEWNKPVMHISWNDANSYCEWLSKKTGKTYRLPTEAEWEFAAGSGAKHYKYSWGSYEPIGSENVGNVTDDTTHSKYGKRDEDRFVGYTDNYYFSAPVGSFQPNELGLYDMTGNVMEWCSDWYDAEYYTSSPTIDPKGPLSAQRRVNRGGSWNVIPAGCTVANRWRNTPVSRNSGLGFRLVSP